MRRFSTIVALALTAVLTHAVGAGAAPVTYEAPGGFRVTFPAGDTYRPGDSIEFVAEGFFSQGIGNPYLAVKPYGSDTLDYRWGYGGESRSNGPEGAQDASPIWFLEGKTGAAGQLKGYIELPSQIGAMGPMGVSNGYGHMLMFLSGRFAEGTEGAATSPVGIQAYFNVVPPTVRVGYMTPAGRVEGDVIAAGQGNAIGLSVAAAGFDPGATLTATLSDVASPVTATATAEGTATFTFNVPANYRAGATDLTVTDGTYTATRTLTAVTHSATVLTPKVRPGGRVHVRVSGYRGITGAGQRVALLAHGGPLTAQVALGCATVDATGSATIVGTLPVDAPLGSGINVSANAGARCLTPPVTDPLPRSRTLAGALTIADVVPTLATPQVRANASGSGASVVVDGAGFTSGETITAQVGGIIVPGFLRVLDASTFSATVPLPPGLPVGSTVDLVVTSPSAGAATPVTIVAPASVAVTSGPIHPGGTVSVALANFVSQAGTAGQRVGVKLDDAGSALGCVQTDATGAGTLTFTLPADVTLGAHFGRILAGSSCVSGGPVNDLPGRSLQAPFTVVAAPAPPTPVAPPERADPSPAGPAPQVPRPTAAAPPVRKPSALAVVGRGQSLRLSVATGAAQRVSVAVRTAAKVRLRPRGPLVFAQLVTPVTVRTTATTKALTLRLTATGRRLLAARGALRVTVVLTRPGTKVSTTRTFVLR